MLPILAELRQLPRSKFSSVQRSRRLMWVGILVSVVEASQAVLVLCMAVVVVALSMVALVVAWVLWMLAVSMVAEAPCSLAVMLRLAPCFVQTGCAVMLMVGAVPALVVGLVVVVCLLVVVVVYVLDVVPLVVVVSVVVVVWGAKLVFQRNPQEKRSQRLCGVEL